MSRYGGDYESDSNYGFLWPSRVDRIIKGKRGQGVMREFIDALDALPEKRLIMGSIATKEGDVCAVGALAKAKGVDLSHLTGDCDSSDTAELGKRIGLTWTLGWEIGFKNDEEMWRCTPEERWQKMRDWAVSQLLVTTS